MATLGAAAVAAFALGVAFASGALVATGLVALGGEYTVSLLIDVEPDAVSAVLFAAVFFAAAELAFWSLELRVHVSREPGIAARRLLRITILSIAALAAAATTLTLTAGEAEPSLDLAALGVAAALAIGGLLTWLALRHRKAGVPTPGA